MSMPCTIPYQQQENCFYCNECNKHHVLNSRITEKPFNHPICCKKNNYKGSGDIIENTIKCPISLDLEHCKEGTCVFVASELGSTSVKPLNETTKTNSIGKNFIKSVENQSDNAEMTYKKDEADFLPKICPTLSTVDLSSRTLNLSERIRESLYAIQLIKNQNGFMREKLIQEQNDLIKKRLIQDQKDLMKKRLIQEQKDLIRKQIIRDQSDFIREQTIRDQNDFIREQIIRDQNGFVKEQIIRDQNDFMQKQLLGDLKINLK